MIGARHALFVLAVGLASLVVMLRSVAASEPALDVPVYDGADGATCAYFNEGASILWQRRGGDWVDRKGVLHGDEPHAQQRVPAENRVRPIQINVTELVVGKAQAQRGHLELMLREISDRAGGTIHFFSRETKPDLEPRLVVELFDGRTLRIAASADAQVTCSTFRSLGTGEWLSVANNASTVVAFDLKSMPAAPIKRALLSLTTRQKQYGAVTLGVFELANPMQRKPVETTQQVGLASRYPNDAGIARDPSVMFFEDFETTDWRGRWSEVSGDLETVGDRGKAGFAPHAGRAVRVRIVQGRSYGGSVRFKFRERMGSEPEQAYFRYMLRFGDDWLPTPEGGKLPGFASTYGRAAWGGRKADGTNGWSARGSFNAATRPENPLHRLTTIGFYTYHADMKERYGDGWPWTERTPALLANNRWYSVEHHVKLNTPGKNDGVLRAWVDGRLVFERTDVRFRDTSELRIEELWMNIYFGGTRPSARTMHLFIDNVVIADRYIGPVAAGTATSAFTQR